VVASCRVRENPPDPPTNKIKGLAHRCASDQRQRRPKTDRMTKKIPPNKRAPFGTSRWRQLIEHAVAINQP
jgi:hypothetical protein